MTDFNDLPALPLGTSDFKTLRLQKKIYVDKTALICELASLRQKFFFTRPRRFGKTLLINTLVSLFRDGVKDFSGLAIEKRWKDKTYRVVKIDFSEIKNVTSAAAFEKRLGGLLIASFEPLGFRPEKSDDLDIIHQLAFWLEQQDPDSLVLLIDEYDAPLTACLGDKARFEAVGRALARFYAVVKSCDGCWRFVFVTGITKVYPTSIFSSEFNQYTDISLASLFAPLAGFTEEDIDQCFSGHVEAAARVLNLPREELRRELRKHYAGYCFDKKASQPVYAPWSVLNLFSRPSRGFRHYWVESGGNLSALLQYMQPDSLKDPRNYASEQYVRIDDLECASSFDDLWDVVLLTQAGYLTIKRRQGRTFFVNYPNQEVADAMATLYFAMLLRNQTLEAVGAGDLQRAIMTGDVTQLFESANRAFAAIDYVRYPIEDEKHCQSFLQVFIAGAGYNVTAERHGALGRSDLELDSESCHWVLEIKFQRQGEAVEELLAKAVEQITEKQYGATADKPLFRVAAVFSEEKRQFVRWQQVA